MGKINNEPVVYIKAIVSKAMLDSVQYKPYLAELTFDEKLVVEVPVPATEVRKDGETFILTLQGWTAFLKNYTNAITEMNRTNIQQQYR
jgi:hypothetical protein